MRTKEFTFKKTQYVKKETSHKAISLDLTADEAQVLADLLSVRNVAYEDRLTPEALFLEALSAKLHAFTAPRLGGRRLCTRTWDFKLYAGARERPFSNGDQEVTGTIPCAGVGLMTGKVSPF